MGMTYDRDTLLAELREQNESLKLDVDELRNLIQCVECSAMLGDADHHGWMPNMCPECQADAALRDTEER